MKIAAPSRRGASIFMLSLPPLRDVPVEPRHMAGRLHLRQILRQILKDLFCL